ncbi:MAG: SDR family oxidoreductase [Thermoleophilia bacterium]|nr:SDR family oxidoreductase [Thermoleophilia bacterium]
MRVEGSTFLVTGGGSGLGAATARALAEGGANVVVADLREGEAPGRFVETDVRDAESVRAAVRTAVDEFGALNGAVNCAGIGWAERVLGREAPHDLERFQLVVEVNLVGTFNVVRLAAEAIAQAEPSESGERGVIVNTASVAAFEGQVGQVAYSASKGGVVGMMLPIARELARFGIRCCTIAPGIMDTAMMAQASEEVRSSLEAQVQFPKRFGRPEEYAALVCHLVENEYLNGEVFRLDGGIRMAAR